MMSETPSADRMTGKRMSVDDRPRRNAGDGERAPYWPRHADKPATAVAPEADHLLVKEQFEYRGRHAAPRQPLGLAPSEPTPALPSPRNPGPAADDLRRRQAADDLRRRQLEGLEVLFRLANATAETQPLPLVSSTRPDAEAAAGPRVLALFKDPALRGAAALVLSNVMSGGLSFAFWAVTARYQQASGVGAVSAEVSAVTFLASVGSLNLINVFARFIPEAGWHARRMILISYSAAILAGSLGAVIFLFTPLASGLVIGGGAGRQAFALCVILNSVFMIQDGGLVGFGRAGWVPVENILVALARLALFPLSMRFFSASTAVLWSWALPMAAAVVTVNTIIIGRLAGRRQAKKRPSLPPVRQLGRFVAIESVTTAIAAAVSAFLPALVTRRLGAAQGGYFYVPWIITTMASLLFTSILISMVREAVATPQKASFTIRRSLNLVLAMVIAGMMCCSFFAKLALAPMGHDFAANGAPLLWWVGLSLPAAAANLMYWALCLVRRRPWPVFAVNLTTSAVMIGGVMLLRAGTDISRVGLIYCLAQWTVAAVVTFPAIKTLRVMLNPQETK